MNNHSIVLFFFPFFIFKIIYINVKKGIKIKKGKKKYIGTEKSDQKR